MRVFDSKNITPVQCRSRGRVLLST